MIVQRKILGKILGEILGKILGKIPGIAALPDGLLLSPEYHVPGICRASRGAAGRDAGVTASTAYFPLYSALFWIR
jgi:hypothetical protein